MYSGLWSHRGEKNAHVYFMMVPLRSSSTKKCKSMVLQAQAQLPGGSLYITSMESGAPNHNKDGLLGRQDWPESWEWLLEVDGCLSRQWIVSRHCQLSCFASGGGFKPFGQALAAWESRASACRTKEVKLRKFWTLQRGCRLLLSGKSESALAASRHNARSLLITNRRTKICCKPINICLGRWLVVYVDPKPQK